VHEALGDALREALGARPPLSDDPDGGAGPSARADDAAALDAACASAAVAVAARWPDGWIAPSSFAAHVAARLDPSLPAAAALAELHVVDLYLACACVHRVAAAVRAFEVGYVAELPAALRAMDRAGDLVDEVLQRLREKMLVGDESGPRLDAYSGHGPLGAWLRVAATRIALSLQRRARPEAPDDLAELIDPAASPEVRVLAARVGASLREALRVGVAAQPPRTRAVLRLYYGDGRGVEEIGRVYRVHASTVSRWLARARADILAATRAHLAARLGASTSELDSLLAEVPAMELSLTSVLGEPSGRR
jgi:RNA polymerase sigma-70 factor (ECF subfamily)